MLGADVMHDAAAIAVGQRHQAGDGVERGVDVAALVGHELRTIGRPVGRERDAEAVDDKAARRRDEADADPVLVGERLVAAGLDHLEEIEPAGHGRQQRDLAAGEEQRAPRQKLAADLFALEAHGGADVRTKARCSRTRI